MSSQNQSPFTPATADGKSTTAAAFKCQSAGSRTNPETAFSRFAELPPELRSMIWTEAARAPVVHQFNYQQKTYGTHSFLVYRYTEAPDNNFRLVVDESSDWCRADGRSALLRVNRESRHVVKQLGADHGVWPVKRQVVLTQDESPGVFGTSNLVSDIVFDPSGDLLCLGNCLSWGPDLYDTTTGGLISIPPEMLTMQKVGIEMPREFVPFANANAVFAQRVVQNFPDCTKIYFVVPEPMVVRGRAAAKQRWARQSYLVNHQTMKEISLDDFQDMMNKTDFAWLSGFESRDFQEFTWDEYVAIRSDRQDGFTELKRALYRALVLLEEHLAQKLPQRHVQVGLLATIIPSDHSRWA